MRGFLWFMLLVGLGAASVVKPDSTAHQQKIYAISTGNEPPAVEILTAMPEWKELEFTDFYLCTATRSKTRKSLVSYGFYKHVKVVDRSWWEYPQGRKTVEQ